MMKWNIAQNTAFLGLIAIGFVVAGSCYSEEGTSEMSTQVTIDKVTHTNRLVNETSPYLLQHKHNPVDWYPWGEEALKKAKKEGKPIFLSIGYSACHWCHVMERESFEDPAIAKIINEHFIPIKVDREERPEIDEIYMSAVQIMTGRGGWPLSVFLTPDLKPYFGGTYFPTEDKYGMPAFRKVLLGMADAWENKQGDVLHNAEKMMAALEKDATMKPAGGDRPDRETLEVAALGFRYQIDPTLGGFAGAPKFPPSAAIGVLLRQYKQENNPELLKPATVTLDRMARGGMYDQVGGGFHRYSVDRLWLVPHFEKMLYDNALLAQAYLEAWQLTKNDFYRRIAVETLDYVLRDMTDARGGFHSAEDADSEGVEGKYYVWTPEEIKDVLGETDAKLVIDYFGVTEEGNFEERSILWVPREPAEIARKHGISEKEMNTRLAALREKLLAARTQRIRPGKDDKVLAAWNGMMISALARGYQVTGDQRYLDAADRAADFVLGEMMRDDGTLLRTYRGAGGPDGKGESKLPGYLDDYAEMADGLIDLYETTFDRRRLDQAYQLTEKMLADFWDEKEGGFFYTSDDHKNLLVRTKPFEDMAVPSGNSTATMVLLRLARLLDKPEYTERADTIFELVGRRMRNVPRYYVNLLCALDFRLNQGKEIVVAGRPDAEDTAALLRVVHDRFLPGRVIALAPPEAAAGDHQPVPLLADKRMIGDRATVYVCENFTCSKPVNTPEELKTQLGVESAVPNFMLPGLFNDEE